PVRIVERLGQQSELVTNAFVNVTPWSTSRRRTTGIDQSVSQRWSSVRMRTMFGCRGPASGGGGVTVAGGAAPAAVVAELRSTSTTTPTATTVRIPTVAATATSRRIRSREPTGTRG